MRTRLLLLLMLALVVLLARASTQPEAFRLRRGVAVRGTRTEVFHLVDDVRAWRRWCPWVRFEPGTTVEIAGPANGRGATCRWDGGAAVGRGRLEITESDPPSRLVARVERASPFEPSFLAELTFETRGDDCWVTCTVRGSYPFPYRLWSTVSDVDAAMVRDIEQGLANLGDAVGR